MSWELDATDWTRQLSSPLHDGNNPKSLRASIAAAISMSLSLTTAGRLGFFIDYSELETVGTHNFYVTRTHGSQGAVGCTWTAYDSAGGAQLATGSLSWANHSLDVLSFQVPVTSKPAGDHRIYVLLSNPTGGAALHHGDSTVAYGIIDDDTIATSNAIFIDADAETNGTGTQTSPFNNWYSARDAVLITTRFVYIKGLMVPDTTDSPFRVTAKHFKVLGGFGNRTSESQRIVVRNWPNFVGGVSGLAAGETAGFLLDTQAGNTPDLRYITFKGLDFQDLDSTAGGIGSTGSPGFAIWTKGGAGDVVEYITGENINVNRIVSGKTSAIGVWYSEDVKQIKMWKWNVQNASYGESDNGNMMTFECYRTDNVSIQNCTLGQTAGDLFQKECFSDVIKVGPTIRFNFLDGPRLRINNQGSTRLQQDFNIVQNNVIVNSIMDSNANPLLLDNNGANSSVSTKSVVSNNTFYNYERSSLGHITSNSASLAGICIYNNIFSESDVAVRVRPEAAPLEYLDYNFYQNNVKSPQPRFANRAFPEINLATLQSTSSFEANAVTGNPIFIDAENGDFTLTNNSPALTGGVSGTTMGAFAQDFIQIGVN